MTKLQEATMTAVHPTTVPGHRPATQADATVAVRRVVLADAAVTGAGGALLLATASWTADLVGLANSGPVVIIGAFFVVLAAVMALLGRADDERLLRLVPLNAVGDLGWAVASVATVVLVDLSGTGRVLIAVQALAVLAIGEAKLITVHRARSTR